MGDIGPDAFGAAHVNVLFALEELANMMRSATPLAKKRMHLARLTAEILVWPPRILRA